MDSKSSLGFAGDSDAKAEAQFKSKNNPTVNQGEELMRRHDLARGNQNQSSSSAKPIRHPYTQFEDPNQQVYLINVAHTNQRPKKDKPAFRFLGFKQSLDDLRWHANNIVAPKMTDCNIFVGEAAKWMLLCRSKERQLDTQYCHDKIAALKEIWLADEKSRNEDFSQNKKKQTKGAQGLSLYKKRQNRRLSKKNKRNARLVLKKRKHRQDLKELEENRLQPVRDCDPSIPLRKQEYVVASILPDFSTPVMNNKEDPEPAVCFWRAFPDYESAHDWIVSIGSAKVRKFHLDIYDMYEWIFPEDMDMEHVNEVYRHEEQNILMSQKKKQKQDLVDFESWCEEKDMKVPETIVEGDTLANADSIREPVEWNFDVRETADAADFRPARPDEIQTHERDISTTVANETVHANSNISLNLFSES